MALKIDRYSHKQLKILSWWMPGSPVADMDGVICDGAIRSGKTTSFGLSFIEWTFEMFPSGQNFIMSGKTVGSFRRNMLSWLLPSLEHMGFYVNYKRTENMIEIANYGKSHTYYVFGGRDESSQDLVQGVTAAGALFDEVVLMPESFVNQAAGRCSVDGAKLWFNCNPGSPVHWFKLEWLDKCVEKKLFHLHFTMVDNPGLSESRREYYRNLYVGARVFFKRYILGLWVMAEGAIYDCFNDDENLYDEIPYRLAVFDRGAHDIAIDYGTQNATVFLHIIDDGETVWVDNEYYHSGRSTGMQKTNRQYADDLKDFASDLPIGQLILDPAAASFKVELQNDGWSVLQAENDVLPGIERTASFIARRIIKINRRCVNLIREIQGYSWDTKRTEKGDEQPVKKDDHGCDALRYYVYTKLGQFRLQE